MTNIDFVELLKQGPKPWNEWRRQNPRHIIDLTGAELGGFKTGKVNFAGVNLTNANLGGSLFNSSDFTNAILYQAECFKANLNGANFLGADLRGAKFHLADLRRASLRNSNLYRVDFISAILEDVDFTGAKCETTAFSNVDISKVIGLSKIKHRGPSNVDVATLFRSNGKLPEAFLRGCGVPDALIEYLPSLIDAMQPIQYYSCFISYSSIDEDFARRIYDRMLGDSLRVWYANEELKGGEKLIDQIDEAIRVYDKLVLVLSEASMKSSWVQTELRRARVQEQRGGKRKLFPIRVVPMEHLQEWTLFDADTGTDLAAEVRSYFIPDFSNWKDHDAFEEAYARLLRDLKAAA